MLLRRPNSPFLSKLLAFFLPAWLRRRAQRYSSFIPKTKQNEKTKKEQTNERTSAGSLLSALPSRPHRPLFLFFLSFPSCRQTSVCLRRLTKNSGVGRASAQTHTLSLSRARRPFSGRTKTRKITNEHDARRKTHDAPSSWIKPPERMVCLASSTLLAWACSFRFLARSKQKGFSLLFVVVIESTRASTSRILFSKKGFGHETRGLYRKIRKAKKHF